MKIVRIFPRKTNATPNDNMVFFGDPPEDLDFDDAYISTTFTYDKEKAERLAESWDKIKTVKLGGPAYDHPGSNFTPGMFLKKVT